MRETINVIQSSERRVKVFIDFWNVVIAARSQTSFDVELRWDAFVNLIVRETQSSYGENSNSLLAGCYIFGSYDKSNGEQYKFIKKTLDFYGWKEGLYFDFKERISKTTTHKCGACGAPMQRSSELGVDVLLTVEMIKHASMREHE